MVKVCTSHSICYSPWEYFTTPLDQPHTPGRPTCTHTHTHTPHARAVYYNNTKCPVSSTTPPRSGQVTRSARSGRTCEMNLQRQRSGASACKLRQRGKGGREGREGRENFLVSGTCTGSVTSRKRTLRYRDPNKSLPVAVALCMEFSDSNKAF